MIVHLWRRSPWARRRLYRRIAEREAALRPSAWQRCMAAYSRSIARTVNTRNVLDQSWPEGGHPITEDE